MERQPGTKSGRRLDSGNDDCDEQATEVEQHDAAAHRDEPRSGKAAEDAQRHTHSGRSVDSGCGDGNEHATEGEQRDAAAPFDEPRSGEATGEAARHEEQLEPRQRQRQRRCKRHVAQDEQHDWLPPESGDGVRTTPFRKSSMTQLSTARTPRGQAAEDEARHAERLEH